MINQQFGQIGPGRGAGDLLQPGAGSAGLAQRIQQLLVGAVTQQNSFSFRIDDVVIETR